MNLLDHQQWNFPIPIAYGPGLLFDGFYQAVCQILDDVGIPEKLHDIGVPLDCAPMIVRRAFEDDATPTNPRQANVTEIENLIDNALTTGR